MLPQEPHVAVLMSVHAETCVAHLDESLRSLREQTWQNLRIFVYCDGQLSKEHEAVLSLYLNIFAGKDILIRNATNNGLPTGLNRLIDEAIQQPEIEFIARMDADDISLPDRIHRQVEFMRLHPDVSVLGTWCVEFAKPRIPIFFKKLPIELPNVKKFMLCRNALAHPTVMFRRGVFDVGHRYDVSLNLMQDYELWARLLSAGYVISNVPEFLLWFRINEEFFSRRSGVQRALSEINLRIRYARQAGLMRPLLFLQYVALFLLRISPQRLKRFAYLRFR